MNRKTSKLLAQIGLAIFIMVMSTVLIAQTLYYSQLLYMDPTIALISADDVVFINSQFENAQTINFITVAIAALITLLLIKYSARKKVMRTIGNKTQNLLFAILAISIVILAILGFQAVGSPNWYYFEIDTLYYATVALLENGSFDIVDTNLLLQYPFSQTVSEAFDGGMIEYFQMYPFQLATLTVFIAMAKVAQLFGLSSLFTPLMVMQVGLYILVSYLLFKSLRKKFGLQSTIPITIFATTLLFIPTYNQLMYPYNYMLATLAILFGYHFVTNHDYKLKWLILGAIVFIIGGLFRSTVLIVPIAIAIVIILYGLTSKKKLHGLLFIAIVFGGYFAMSTIIPNLYGVTTEKSFGVSNFLVIGANEQTLGTNGGGIIQENTRELTELYSKKRASEINFNIVKTVYADNTLLENIEFMLKKVKIMWGIGDFNMHHNILSIYNQTGELGVSRVTRSTEYGYLQMFMTIFINTIYMLSLYIAIKIFKDPLAAGNKQFMIVAITFIGAFIFYAFWEVRGRYVYQFMPLFIWVVVEYYYQIKVRNAEFKRVRTIK